MKKNVFSRAIAVLASMTVLGAASMMSASAAGEGIALDSATALPGETVTLTVSVTGDTAAQGCVVSVTYPEALEAGNLLTGALTGQPAESNGDGTATAVAAFVNGNGLDAAGFTTVTFTVPEDAEAGTVYDIGLGVTEFSDGVDIFDAATATGGTIEVVAPATDAPTEPATDAPTEPATDAPTEPEIEATIVAPTEAPTTAAPTTAAPTTKAAPKAGAPKTGSTGVVAAVAGLTVAGAAAVVLKKKH